MTVQASYDNHDHFVSPLGVEDNPVWLAQVEVPATGTFISSGNGYFTTQIAIETAGEYLLSIEVENEQIRDFPYAYLKIWPQTEIYAPNSVLVDLPEVMEANFSYQFFLQGRDIFFNNLVSSA